MTYTLDASAVLAFLKDEKGKSKVQWALHQKPEPFIHAINFLEVDYHLSKNFPQQYSTFKNKLRKLPMTIAQILTPDITDYAKYLKAKYKLSLADSIGVALNAFLGTTFLTSDRHELEVVSENEKVKIEFLR